MAVVSLIIEGFAVDALHTNGRAMNLRPAGGEGAWNTHKGVNARTERVGVDAEFNHNNLHKISS